MPDNSPAPQPFPTPQHAPAPTERERMLARIVRPYPAATAVVTDPDGRVLLVESFNRAYWGCPGGVVEPDEAPQRTAARELEEETGLRLTAGKLLLITWVTADGSGPEQLPGVQFWFDMGTVDPALPLRLQPEEIKSAAWAAPAEVSAHMGPLRASRLRAALAARDRPGDGGVEILPATRAEIVADGAAFARAVGWTAP